MKCFLNYEYDNSKMRLFVSSDYGPVFIEQYIDYSSWSENKLKYLDTILEDRKSVV